MKLSACLDFRCCQNQVRDLLHRKHKKQTLYCSACGKSFKSWIATSSERSFRISVRFIGLSSSNFIVFPFDNAKHALFLYNQNSSVDLSPIISPAGIW